MTSSFVHDQRFWSKVEKTVDCWLWVAADNGNGYPVFSEGGENCYAHRYIYEQLNGLVPEELEIDHKCRVRNCVNPEHLEAVTHEENIRRAYEHVTHCPKGHEYNEENTRILTRGNGRRQCKVCDRESSPRSRRVKITQELIDQVLELLEAGEPQRSIASRVGISQGYVSRIKRGEVQWQT